MALWVGGLVGFAQMAWRAATLPATGLEAGRLALAIPAFSQLAIPAVAALSVSGLVLARLHLTAWGDLVRTAYGRWLVAKLVVFAAMLALGAYHQQRVYARLREGLARVYTGSDGLSRMPDYGDVLTVRQLIDLVAYLRSLTGDHPPSPADGGPGHRTPETSPRP
jgi:putative copper export protein